MPYGSLPIADLGLRNAEEKCGPGPPVNRILSLQTDSEPINPPPIWPASGALRFQSSWCTPHPGEPALALHVTTRRTDRPRNTG